MQVAKLPVEGNNGDVKAVDDDAKNSKECSKPHNTCFLTSNPKDKKIAGQNNQEYLYAKP